MTTVTPMIPHIPHLRKSPPPTTSIKLIPTAISSTSRLELTLALKTKAGSYSHAKTLTLSPSPPVGPIIKISSWSWQPHGKESTLPSLTPKGKRGSWCISTATSLCCISPDAGVLPVPSGDPRSQERVEQGIYLV